MRVQDSEEQGAAGTPLLPERVGTFLGVEPPKFIPEGTPTPQPGVAESMRRHVPEILATGLPMGVPIPAAGAPILRRLGAPLARVGVAEAGNLIGRALTGQDPMKGLGYGAGPQTAGEIVSGGLGFFLNPVFRKAFASRSASELADALKSVIPEFKTFTSNAKGLYEMAHGTGQRVLSDAYQKVLTTVKDAVPENAKILVPFEFIDALKKSKQVLASEVPAFTKKMGYGDTFVYEVPMRYAIDALGHLRDKSPAVYRGTLKAIHEGLAGVEGMPEVYNAGRKAYTWGQGWIDFATKGKFLYGKKYAPEVAQAALDPYGKSALLGRGMDPIRDIVEGPGASRMTAHKLSPWASHWVGAGLGGALGTATTGHVWPGGAIGGMIGMGLPPFSIYRNVPRGAVGQTMQRVVPSTVAEAVRHSLGLRDQPPQAGAPVPAGVPASPSTPMAPSSGVEGVSRSNAAYKAARKAGLTDQQIEQRYGIRLTD